MIRPIDYALGLRVACKHGHDAAPEEPCRMTEGGGSTVCAGRVDDALVAEGNKPRNREVSP